MSTNLIYDPKTVDALLTFSTGIISGKPGRELIDALRAAVTQITPHDLLQMEEVQLQRGISGAKLKASIGKVLNVLYPFLTQYQWAHPEPDTFLGLLMAENQGLMSHLQGIKAILRRTRDREGPAFQALRGDLLEQFTALEGFESHYVKKENILFPFLERTWDSYRPLKVMWALHDDIRHALKTVISLLDHDEISWDDLKRPVGDYFFLAIGMIYKEDRLIFPAAAETVPAEHWLEMHRQSFDYSFPFIDQPDQPELSEPVPPRLEDALISTPTGTLSTEQLILMLGALPVDVTLVDQDDKVRFFTRPAERIFPRSPAIIGRDVRNCHPPDSVHIVEKIIAGFRAGEKDTASFWLRMGERFILINYYALHTEEGAYRGVLEVSQDITELRQLEGERRLLDW